MAIYEDYYVINSNSHIKSVPNFLCTEFLKELKNDDGTLKPHISDLDTNATYCQLCGITNSKMFPCTLYDYMPEEIDIDEFTRVYIKRIDALIDVIKTGKPLNIYFRNF